MSTARELRDSRMHDTVLTLSAAPPPKRRERQLVLLAEDDPADLDMYGSALWYNGFDVLEASDGPGALELALTHQPDIVLLDLLLPELTGIEVCRRLRKRGFDPPVVALTARSRREFGPVTEDVGFSGYLEKPIPPLDVLHYVENVVGRPPPPGEDVPGDG